MNLPTQRLGKIQVKNTFFCSCCCAKRQTTNNVLLTGLEANYRFVHTFWTLSNAVHWWLQPFEVTNECWFCEKGRAYKSNKNVSTIDDVVRMNLIYFQRKKNVYQFFLFIQIKHFYWKIVVFNLCNTFFIAVQVYNTTSKKALGNENDSSIGDSWNFIANNKSNSIGNTQKPRRLCNVTAMAFRLRLYWTMIDMFVFLLCIAKNQVSCFSSLLEFVIV